MNNEIQKGSDLMKQKRTKRIPRLGAVILSVLLVLSVTLTGCSTDGQNTEDKTGTETDLQEGSAGKEGARGRYVETLLESPDGYEGGGTMGILENGSFVIVDCKNGTVSTSEDRGKSWKTDRNKELQAIANKADITSAAVAPDGGIFISYIIWEESSDQKLFPEKYVYIGTNGKKDEFELGLEKYKSNVVQAVFHGNKTVFAVCNSDAVYSIDLKKRRASKVIDVEASQDFGLFRCGDTVGIRGGDQVYRYEDGTKDMVPCDQVLNDYVKGEQSERVIFGGGKDGKILAASSGGIVSHVPDGNVMEQLADGALCSLGDPSRSPEQMFVLDDGVIVILYEDGELDSYAYDAQALAVPDKQLKVYSLRDNITVRQAIHAFRKNHQDVYVKVINGLSGEDGMTESDAVKNLNTELLAGKGPDVIMLDGMPVDSYVEKGMLLELNDVAAQLKESGSFFTNILEAYSHDGKLYTLPIRYTLPIAAGDKEIVSGITDLNTLADAVSRIAASGKCEETVLGTYDETELLKRLWIVCAGAWIKDGKEADQQSVVEFLKQAKRIYEAEQKNLDNSERRKHEDMISRFEEANIEYDNLDGNMQLNSMMMGGQRVVAGIFKSMSDIRMLCSVMNKEKAYSWQAWQAQQSKVFIPSGLAGISSGASDQQLAVEFVKTLLGAEVQQKDLGDGFPVNRDAFSDFCKNPNPESQVSISMKGSDDSGESYALELVWPSKEQLSQLEKMIETLQNPSNTMGSIMEEALRIGGGALSGDKEIEACAQEIYEKIRLFYEE